MNALREEILGLFGVVNQVTLATVDHDKPRLRPMTVVRWGKAFYFATRTDSKKVSQLTSNHNIEFILPLRDEKGNGYVRVECLAEFVEEENIRSSIFDEFEFVRKLWTEHNDPNLTIVRLIPLVYDYMRPGEWNSILVSE